MSGIRNVGNNILPKLLVVSTLINSANTPQEVHNLYDRVRLDMISKAIEGSITKTSLNKTRLHQKKYDWDDTGGLIRNDVPTMLYFLLKSINPDTRIGVYNLKDEIDR